MTAMNDEDLLDLVAGGTPFMDVRAPVEFAQGSIPGSRNFPLLDDHERDLVGKAYKSFGQEAAIKLGHELVGGVTRDARLATWRAFIDQNTDAWIYCFRGGQRSHLVQAALSADIGRRVPLIEGGYKRARQAFLNLLETLPAQLNFVVLGGFTGSGKTELLSAMSAQNGDHARVCDLEALSGHRGSAFGRWPSPQPSQVDFENALTLRLRHLQRQHHAPILIEDESRTIGQTVLPQGFFARATMGRLAVIIEDVERRAERLLRSYLFENYRLDVDHRNPIPAAIAALSHDMQRNLLAIERRLGGAERQKLSAMVESAATDHATSGDARVHLEWVTRLLEIYYDRLYAYHLDKQADRIIARGSAGEIRHVLEKLLLPS